MPETATQRSTDASNVLGNWEAGVVAGLVGTLGYGVVLGALYPALRGP